MKGRLLQRLTSGLRDPGTTEKSREGNSAQRRSPDPVMQCINVVRGSTDARAPLRSCPQPSPDAEEFLSFAFLGTLGLSGGSASTRTKNLLAGKGKQAEVVDALSQAETINAPQVAGQQRVRRQARAFQRPHGFRRGDHAARFKQDAREASVALFRGSIVGRVWCFQ